MVTVMIAQLRITHSSDLLTRQLTSVVRQKSDNLNQQITGSARPKASATSVLSFPRPSRDHSGTTM